jgi:hypothetical protein
MPNTLQTNVMGTNILTPVQFPEQAKWTAGIFAPSQANLLAGQVLGANTNGALLAWGGGTNQIMGLNMYTLSTDAAGNVFINNGTNASIINTPTQTSPYFISGTFDTNDLAGWNTNAATAFGARSLYGSIVRIP